MKLSMPVKLTIFVLVLFALVIASCLLWRPIKVRYYAAKLHSDNVKVRQHAVRILLDLETEGPKDRGTNRPVFNYYTDRYDPKDVKKRIRIAHELYACGNKGKEVIKEIFRNWCYSQQVRIPAGTLTLSNGSKVDIKSLWVDKFEVTWEKYNVFTQLYPDIMRQLHPRIEEEWWLGRSDGLPYANEANGNSNILPMPVVLVTCQEARIFANSLGMDLPTHNEWKYAALAGSTGKYHFGDNESMLGEYAWYEDNSAGKPHPVGRKRPNNWGIYDVLGNVGEWCMPEGTDRSQKFEPYEGGDCNSESYDINDSRSAWNLQDSYIGFRCVRDVK